MDVIIRNLATKKETFNEGFKQVEKPGNIAASFAVIKMCTGSLHKELKGVIPL